MVVKRIESARILQSELVNAACAATGKKAEEANEVIGPVVEHLQKQYGGTKLYIPKLGRTVSAEDVHRDIALGLSGTRICKKYGISRRTYLAMKGEG